MRSILSPLLAAAPLAILASACAATPPPVVAPVVAPKPAPPPPPDVSAVPTPENLILYGRFGNVSASTKILTDWVSVPPLPPGALFEGALQEIMGSKDYAPFANIVDPAQPIDFAISFEASITPKGLGAISAALKDIDAAKSALASTFDLTPGDNGIIHVAPRAGLSRVSSEKAHDEQPACELAPAAGAAAFRLVCASSDTALGQLGPYLTRTTTRTAGAPDLHVEVHASPLAPYATLGRTQGASILMALAGVSADSTPATADLVSAAITDVFDLVGDLDTQGFDITLDKAHAGFTYRSTFKSATSLMARLAVAHPERADVPPEVVWRLPASVDLATFGSGIDETDLQHPRDLIVAAINEQLKKDKAFSEADRRAIADAFAHSMRSERAVFAHGMSGTTSYWLLEEDEPASTAEKSLRELLAVWNRPAVVKWLKSDDHAGKALPRIAMGGPIAGLPKGSLHIVVTIPPEVKTNMLAAARAPKGPRGGSHPPLVAATNPPGEHLGPPEVYHLVVMPDGTHTWFCASTSEAAIKSALGAIATKGSDSLGNHATERGLASWKEARMSSGGYLTVVGFIDMIRGALGSAPKDVEMAKKWDALIPRLPAKGTTPILMRGTPLAGTKDDPAGIHEVQFDIPAEAIRDVVWFSKQLD